MTLTELIAKLQALHEEHGDIDIMILDGWNGGGVPRTINLGPTLRTITQAQADETADCEDIVSDTVAVLGFGCY